MRNLLIEYNTIDEGHAIIGALWRMGYRKVGDYTLFEKGGYVRTVVGEIVHGPKEYIPGMISYAEKATFKVSRVEIVVPERQVVIEGKSYDLKLVEEALRGVPFKDVS